MEVGNVPQYVKEYLEKRVYYDFQRLESSSLQGDEEAKEEINLLWRMFYDNGINIDKIVAAMRPDDVLKSFLALKKANASIRLYDLIPELSAETIVKNVRHFYENGFDPKFLFAAAKYQKDGINALVKIEEEDWLELGIEADEVCDLLMYSMDNYNGDMVSTKLNALFSHGLSKAKIESLEDYILENWDNGTNYFHYRYIGQDIVEEVEKWEQLGINRKKFFKNYLNDRILQIWQRDVGYIIGGIMSYEDFLKAFDFENGVDKIYDSGCMKIYFKRMLKYCDLVGGEYKDIALGIKNAVGYDERAAAFYYMLLETGEKGVFDCIDPTEVAKICVNNDKFKSTIVYNKRSNRRKVLRNFKKWGVDMKGIRKKFPPYIVWQHL